MSLPPPGSSLFFSGIAGSGMSALAVYFAGRGYRVSGSDRSFDADPTHPLRAILEEGGIRIVPQDGSGPAGADALVASTAVEEDRPDIRAARQGNVPVFLRPRVLGDLVGTGRSVALAGTSGKSTTAGMLAFVLERLGFDPSYIGGGRVKGFAGLGNPGNVRSGSSDILVAEACEADPSLASYRPRITVIANLALDHRPVEETGSMFRALAAGTRGRVILNADDLVLGGLKINNALTYGIELEADFRGTDLAFEGTASRFLCNDIPFRLRLPGRHNVENALAVLAVLGDMGVPLKRAVEPLGEFKGIVGRFDVHLDRGEGLVVHDYAHNPHKIAALMNAVATARPRTPAVYVFQPHGYGPTRLMREAYREVLTGRRRPDDRVWVLPIFDAGGTAARDVSSEDLVRGLAGVESVPSRAAVLERVGEAKVWIVFGARDESLGDLARAIAGRKGADTEVPS